MIALTYLPERRLPVVAPHDAAPRALAKAGAKTPGLRRASGKAEMAIAFSP